MWFRWQATKRLQKVVLVELFLISERTVLISIVENWKRAITEAEEAKKDGVKNVKTLGNVVMQLRKIANRQLIDECLF